LMYQGKILDGRNRWRACEKAGVPSCRAGRPRLVAVDSVSERENLLTPNEPVA
jgi:hypothetical protein